jgi:hypothetical protein
VADAGPSGAVAAGDALPHAGDGPSPPLGSPPGEKGTAASSTGRSGTAAATEPVQAAVCGERCDPDSRFRAQPDMIGGDSGRAEQDWPATTACPPQDATARSAAADSDRPSDFMSVCELEFQQGAHRIWNDHCAFYSIPSLAGIFVGVGAGAAMANTDADYEVRQWYQNHVRTGGINGMARYWEYVGNGWYVMPAVGVAALAGRVFQDSQVLEPFGDFGDRATRAYVVGGGPLLLMQYTLGAARPTDPGKSSSWNVFENSHGASGNAFVGAVPFITAAKMSDDPWVKGGLYFCSTLPAWARVNDDRHYLSQACLGWWMGYVACQAVNVSEHTNSHFSLTPLTSPEMTGVGVMYQR